MITFPNAKINLGLNIIEKRPDGYHNLETIFYPIHLQDALEVTRRENNDAPYTLHVKGTAIEGKPEDNLVVRAYELLKKDHDIPPVDIHLFKHIPTGAGLGGGSSDCAFMIKLLNEKFRLALSLEEMEDYAARLGADCAFFIRNQPVFATGIGNLFEPVRPGAGETRHLRIHARCFRTHHSPPSRSFVERHHLPTGRNVEGQHEE